MGTRSKDQMSPRIYPWWLILVGFIFGVIVTLIVTSGHPQQGVVYQPYEQQSMDDLGLTATGIIREATLNAQAFNEPLSFPAWDDPILATAAALSGQAGDDNAIFMTATAMVIQATQQTPP